jgi:apolipoprotein N-acyltransferase
MAGAVRPVRHNGLVAFWRGFAQPARYAALVAGAVPVLAFPAPNFEYLAWFGLVPGLLLCRAAPTSREAAFRGWWLGAGYLLAALYWLVPNLGPAVLLIAIVLGAPWAGLGYAAWRLLRGHPDQSGESRPTGQEPAAEQEPTAGAQAQPTGWRARARGVLRVPGPSLRQAIAALVVLPSIWVVTDWIRSWQGIGGPWAVFGASQWQHPLVLALAAVGGIWLISFVLVAANTAITIALTGAGWAVRAVGLAAAIVAVAAGPAAFALTAAEYSVPPTGHMTLDLVQPGLENGPALRLDAEARLTRGLHSVGQHSVGQHRTDLIVWGESSVGYDLYTKPAVLRRLIELSDGDATPLLVSQDALSPAGAKSKVAVLIGRDGIEGTYIKTRLVPFGEYIPFRSVLGWLTSISKAAAQNMIAGHGAHVLYVTLPDGRRLTFGVLICFESSFPDMSAVDASHGAQVIIYQTSDSTFQGSWALAQHASLSAIRAAETGRPTVQAALTGDSAAFDSRGRLLGWLGPSRRGVLKVRVALPPASVLTPFVRYGDYVPWFSIGVVVIAILAAMPISRLVRRSRGS